MKPEVLMVGRMLRSRCSHGIIKGELSLGQLAKRFKGQEILSPEGNTPDQAQAELRSKDGKTSEDHH